jgi:hypothetical protein
LKKAPLLITIGIVFLTIGGFYGYQLFFQKKTISPWDLVPDDAVVVYEKDNCQSCIDDISKSSVWKLIEKVSSYKRPSDSINAKISEAITHTNGVLVSVHATKKDEFDMLYYLPASTQASLLNLFLTDKKYRVNKRAFNDAEIHEVRFSNQVFSYSIIENIWFGSFTPFLVEDVIRTYRSNDADRNLRQSVSFTTIKDDAGNLYFKLEHFSELISLFFKDHDFAGIVPGKSALLDIKATKNEVVLNGFSTDSVDQSRYLLSVFHHQSPVSFGLKQFIPNRTIAVASYGISDGASFFQDLQKFSIRTKKSKLDSLKKINVDGEKLFAAINDEIAVCFFESSRSKDLSKILLIETENIRDWSQSLGQLAQKFSVDTVFYEHYSSYEIREVPVFQFPEKLFYPFVTGFDHCYYTSIGKVLVMGENLEELKNYLDDIEGEDTWGRSVAKNRFLESTLLESNVSLYVNTPRVWNLLAGKMHPRWQSFVTENKRLLQSFQMSSVQFSHLNNSYYTNMLFTYQPFGATVDAQTNEKRSITRFERPLVNLHAVRSHVNRSNEILVQDSLNDLSLVSSDGKVLWKLPIGDEIISDVTQIDFFNNGKLQYFFSTRSAVHIIDRLGNYVDPYPLHFNSISIEHVSVIDYDNSKKYRILVADDKGLIRMFDKEGKPLLGWEPNDAKGGLAMPPKHYRIKGKDYIIAIRKDGTVYLWTRRGEMIRKFPLATESIPTGDIYLERGTTLANTYFVMISSDGYRIRFNPEGKIQSKETLAKTSVFSTFGLVNEKSGKSYLILQQDEKQLQISDEEARKLFSATFTGITYGDVKYFDFGGGKSFMTIRDKSQGFCYVYDGQGNLLTVPPLEAHSIELRSLTNDQFIMFFIHGNSLIIQPL